MGDRSRSWPLSSTLRALCRVSLTAAAGALLQSAPRGGTQPFPGPWLQPAVDSGQDRAGQGLPGCRLGVVRGWELSEVRFVSQLGKVRHGSEFKVRDFTVPRPAQPQRLPGGDDPGWEPSTAHGEGWWH